MSNTITTATIAANVTSIMPVLESLRKEWRVFADKYEIALSKSATLSADKLAAAKEAMINKLNEYNSAKLEAIFDQFLSDPAEALRSLCKAYVWVKAKPVTKTINGTKQILWEESQERFDLLTFLAYATKKEVVLADKDAVYACLKSLAENINALVRADVKGEEGGSVGKSKEALRDLVGTIGVKGVNGRNVDVRFIRSACTKATKLGKLKTITDKDVAPYIMDAYYVQLNGLSYEMDEGDKNTTK